MSHHSDENAIYTSTDSFWEIGNYKRTTKRIEDGNRLCDDLMKLVSERAEIEKMYAKSLKEWAKKWNNIIEKGPEYGTTEAAWKGVLMEAEHRYELHTHVKENLMNEVHSNIKQWQRDNYHKSMMGQLKEKKDIEDLFKKAQKPWAKLFEKVNKCRADYHSACKNERSAQNQERNAGGDSSLSPDQRFQLMKKLTDRVSKAKEEVARGKEKYDASLREISDFNPKYIEDMTHVFEKAQESESKRLIFFKDMLFSTHKCLNISNDPSLPRIYEEFNHTVANADYEKDLKWWSNNHGVNMPMNWPSFEEYSEEFRDISSKGKRSGHIPEGAITLLNQRTVGDDLPEYTPDLQRISKKTTKGAVSGGGDVTLTAVKGTSNNTSATSKSSDNNRHSAVSDPQESQEAPNEEDDPHSQNNGVSGGDDDEWDCSERTFDPNKPGVPVRALYDYEGVEADELSFKVGEVFDKLEDEDEQGWCTGRKDGHVGLYPANYVELI
ncbi:protein kinase C and casein kinase substrate in neurons protein 2-like isoform X3 [Portunus trituberculatus]|uniref:protein kinase C and casein kinase substrate in neurons protein 2-like isoform X3 n=1 Tax=Portunus trituberculatus TaxID=210409 RepID=UPI001E1D0945|nr:protein kinase C and casein kinase substrate in neurons protein 2-like isoform X3 [Portunus trituberculatus]